MDLLVTSVTILCMPHGGSCLTSTPGSESPGQDSEPEGGTPVQAPEGWPFGDHSASGQTDKGNESEKGWWSPETWKCSPCRCNGEKPVPSSGGGICGGAGIEG